ncbi:hypothetical protein KP509_06G043800 [Ceratopteris richardii]|uniref:Integrase zinc-binding domain-containing protein n=1 Tax=Ceratopteris richardii TaxID=49495 RepID=A0A8T2US77_CERRI|nr:hypothetical protein KP509_06G043800 [Ceratopteris richardii]
MADHLSRINMMNQTSGINDDFPDAQLFAVQAQGWYFDIKNFIKTGLYPEKASVVQKKRLLIKSRPYTFIKDKLYRQGKDDRFRKCLEEEEVREVLHFAHEGTGGGHLPGHIMSQRILDAGLWWPTLFKDADEWGKACDICQRCGPKSTKQRHNPLIISAS